MTTITTHRQAFDVYLRRQSDIEIYLQSRTKDPEASAEISRQVMEKIVRSCCNGRPVLNEGAWVRTIARNAAIDYAKRSKQLVDNSALRTNSNNEPPEPYAEIERFLFPLISFLPEKYAEPLRLYLFDQLPQREIAERLGLGLSATKSRIQRARKLLRKEIETCFELEMGPDKKGVVNACLRETCQPLKDFEKKLPKTASFDHN